jgi:cellulose biosynthesis protein BcsQ
MQTIPNSDLKKPFIISMYNHKGGVGKTSTTIALGWKLAELGHKVLLVDTDSQCNLTGLLTNPGTSLLSESNQDKLLELNFDPLERFYSAHPNCNIRTALCSVFDQQYASSLNLVPYSLPPAECFQVCRRQELLPPGISLLPERLIKPPESLYLLAGHMKFNNWDTLLTLACENAAAVAGSQNMLGSFYQLLMRTAEAYEFEYIFIDLSSNMSTINKVFVMSSHFLITPCCPDFSSFMAVEMLADILPEWNQWMQSKSAQSLFQQTILPPPIHRPIFLGYTIQLFTVTNTGSKMPAKAFQSWINKIGTEIEKNLIKNLQPLGMSLPTSLYPQNQVGCLAMIRNYQSANPISNEAHVPVYALTKSVIETTTYSSHIKDMVSDINVVFNDFAYIIANGWNFIPLAQRTKLLTLQWAIHVVSMSNFKIPPTESETIALAKQLISLRRY